MINKIKKQKIKKQGIVATCLGEADNEPKPNTGTAFDHQAAPLKSPQCGQERELLEWFLP